MKLIQRACLTQQTWKVRNLSVYKKCWSTSSVLFILNCITKPQSESLSLIIRPQTAQTDLQFHLDSGSRPSPVLPQWVKPCLCRYEKLLQRWQIQVLNYTLVSEQQQNVQTNMCLWCWDLVSCIPQWVIINELRLIWSLNTLIIYLINSFTYFTYSSITKPKWWGGEHGYVYQISIQYSC